LASGSVRHSLTDAQIESFTFSVRCVRLESLTYMNSFSLLVAGDSIGCHVLDQSSGNLLTTIRINNMFSLISSAVLASSFALTSAHEASACGGGCCGGGSGCAPAAVTCDAQPAAPATPAAKPDMPNMAPKAPATAQSGTQRYRSYSYDAAPVARARQTPSTSGRNPSFYDQVRADRKMGGLR
jgi:hypothetical protein